MRSLLVAMLLLLWFPTGVSAQPWSGIVTAPRAIDWSGVGIVGGVPSGAWANCTTSNCNAVFAGTVTVASIQAAVTDASNAGNQVVRLPAGSFTLSGGLDLRRSNYVLRGQGANQTKLIFTGNVGCNVAENAGVCFWNGENIYGLNATPAPNQVNWTAGYAAGTTAITLSSVPNLSIGSLLILDQLNDAVDGFPAAGDLYVCTSCAWQPDQGIARDQRAQAQVVKVTNIVGNVVTIDPPLRMPNWRSDRSPGAWWGNTAPLTNVGIEDMTVDMSNVSSPAIMIQDVLGAWVRGVRVVQNKTNFFTGDGYRHVRLLNVGRAIVRDSYFYGPGREVGQPNSGVNQYGITVELASDLLVENNILIESPGALEINGPDHGSVWAYNYHVGSWVNTMTQHKGSFMQLMEGNSGLGVNPDIIHASSAFQTQFRNHWVGGASGPSSNTTEWIQSYHRFYNLVGNVLGSASNNTYQSNLSKNGNEIYSLGENNEGTTPGGGSPVTDPRVLATLLRWGNYDTVTGTSRFLASEVPSGIVNFPNTVPATQVLPASFYLSAVPSTWWGTPYGVPPWPAVGPDVTGGNVAGYAGHVYKIPARLCYENMAVDPAYPPANGNPQARIFNASTCYIGGTPPPPPPPPPPTPSVPTRPFITGMILLVALLARLGVTRATV